MDIKIINKASFSVMGKLGQGSDNGGFKWISDLWEQTNKNFKEIQKFEIDNPDGLWGIMSDIDEKFERWGDEGKYLASCEVENGSTAPEGWHMWNVPEQTYLVVPCTIKNYGEVFNNIIDKYIPDNNMQLVGAVHEHYFKNQSPENLELYFPIAKGNYFCQSCGMPMGTDEVRGTNADGTKNNDYCIYCYKDGKFEFDGTMEEAIEMCIPFELEAKVYSDADTARKSMLEYYPKLKRWDK